MASEEGKRILSDIRQFAESENEVLGKKKKMSPEMLDNLQRARNYSKDAEYFMKKGDLFTAWGCANYAHGILDAIRKELGLECYGAIKD